MDLQRQVSRRLYNEHVAILDLLSRFAQVLSRPGGPPTAQDPVWSTLVPSLESALLYEISRHFDFEEEQLFPRMHQNGQGDVAELLFEDHETIRPKVPPLLALLAKVRMGQLDEPGWRSLKATGLELVDLLGSHAEKEQGALVPLIDDLIDEATDQELLETYALA